MPPQLALIGCVVFVCCLVLLERKGRPRVSLAIWLPVIWMAIFGSKPVSLWFGWDVSMETTQDYLEGSPADRIAFFVLIFLAAAVVAARHPDWGLVYRKNKWIIIYFLYLGISVLWSDYPFTAFKRWVKDLGSLLMVLVVLTEQDSLQAMKTALLRCSFILVPFSVLVIKYFPELGRAYDRWTHEPIIVGVTTNKNELGMSLFVCIVSLLWLFIEVRERKKMSRNRNLKRAFLALILMNVWLLSKANSSTALVCSALGCGLLLALRVPRFRPRIENLGKYAIAGIALFVVLHVTLNIGGIFVKLLGRDLTLTGRTEIWKALLKEPVNPLIGAGHYSFWLGDRVDRVSGGSGSYFNLNEAHNGYLEVYLNSGLIGLFILLRFLSVSAKRIKTEALSGAPLGAFRLSILLGTLVYSVTEAVFRVGFISFALFLVVTEYRDSRLLDSFEKTDISPAR
jgi:exopolysaccharide production protein ExoQ